MSVLGVILTLDDSRVLSLGVICALPSPWLEIGSEKTVSKGYCEILLRLSPSKNWNWELPFLCTSVQGGSKNSDHQTKLSRQSWRSLICGKHWPVSLNESSKTETWEREQESQALLSNFCTEWPTGNTDGHVQLHTHFTSQWWSAQDSGYLVFLPLNL